MVDLGLHAFLFFDDTRHLVVDDGTDRCAFQSIQQSKQLFRGRCSARLGLILHQVDPTSCLDGGSPRAAGLRDTGTPVPVELSQNNLFFLFLLPKQDVRFYADQTPIYPRAFQITMFHKAKPAHATRINDLPPIPENPA